VIFALTLIDARGPSPADGNETPDGFSAHRAGLILRNIAGDGRTRALGTAGHDVARDQIVSALLEWGYEPVIETSFACSGRGTCAWVQNVVAHLPGRSGVDSVLVSSHYDSVPAGPGASDDGAGTAAALEIARLLKRGPGLQHDVIFIFADGEEAGLLGAEAFVRSSRHAASVRYVVNLEARGTEGRAFLFETSRDNGRLIALVARHIPRPSTSSLMQTIYERLPNDTDFSVYKRAGKEGVNFGFIGNPSHYHTGLDNVRNTSLRSLQQLGEGGLAMTRALTAETSHSSSRAGNAVFFEVFSRVLFRWPQAWAIPISAITLSGSFMLLLAFVKRKAVRVRAVLMASGSFAFASVIVILVAALAAFVAGRLLETQWMSHPVPLAAFFWLLPLAALLYPASRRWFGRSDRESWMAALLLWAFLAFVVSLALPGASYLFTAPALLSLLAGSVSFRSQSAAIGGGTLLVSAALVVFPLAGSLYDGMGIPAMAVVAALVTLVVISGSFLLARMSSSQLRKLSAAVSVIAAVALATALSSAPFSNDSPRRLNIQYQLDVARNVSHWIVGGASLPVRLVRAARFTREKVQPWSDVESFRAPAPSQQLQPSVVLAVTSDSQQEKRRIVRVALWAGLEAPRIGFAFHDRRMIESLTINGWRIEGETLTAMRRGDWTLLGIRDVARRPNTIEIVSKDRRSLDYVLQEVRYGLPDGAGPLLQARDQSLATASGDGDLTILLKRGSF